MRRRYKLFGAVRFLIQKGTCQELRDFIEKSKIVRIDRSKVEVLHLVYNNPQAHENVLDAHFITCTRRKTSCTIILVIVPVTNSTSQLYSNLFSCKFVGMK